jgi:hypothetical protein
VGEALSDPEVTGFGEKDAVTPSGRPQTRNAVTYPRATSLSTLIWAVEGSGVGVSVTVGVTVAVGIKVAVGVGVAV